MAVVLERVVRKPKGHIIITPEFGQAEEYDTLCCVHCRRHWIVVPGSGIERGWCHQCAGPTCGANHCDRCLPYEKMIEQIEKKATQALRLGV